MFDIIQIISINRDLKAIIIFAIGPVVEILQIYSNFYEKHIFFV